MALGPYELTAGELAAILAADRSGSAFLVLRSGDARLVLHPLDRDVVTVGRAEENDVALTWDAEVSRAHARFERVAGRWTVVDDGLSRNGTFVGEARVSGRRVLEPGALVRIGRTTLVVRTPGAGAVATVVAPDAASAAQLTPAERRVLVALCAPLVHADGGFAEPAANQEIADALVLTVAGVKTQLRALFVKLGVEELPRSRKRGELARRALATGLVGPGDYE